MEPRFPRLQIKPSMWRDQVNQALVLFANLASESTRFLLDKAATRVAEVTDMKSCRLDALRAQEAQA